MILNDNLNLFLDSIKETSPSLYDLFEGGMDYVPYLGKLIQHIKINRLVRRLNDHERQLNDINKLFSETTMSSKYITEGVFPIVLGDLIEEHEDTKINFILNGFQNVFIDENDNESVVINYFDTLRSLRYADIKRLFYLDNKLKSFPLYFEGSDEQALIRSIDSRLEYSGLVGIQKKFIHFEGKELETNKDDVTIKLFGRKFIDFITESNMTLE